MLCKYACLYVALVLGFMGIGLIVQIGQFSTADSVSYSIYSPADDLVDSVAQTNVKALRAELKKFKRRSAHPNNVWSDRQSLRR